MAFEQYTRIFDGGADGETLRPRGEAFSLTFPYAPKADTRYRLFTVGETAMYYQHKCEDPTIYHEITDSLNSREAKNARFALDFSASKPFSYVRKAYKKLMWPPILIGWQHIPLVPDWEYGISAKAEGLSIGEGGYVRIRVDVRYKKDGISPYDSIPAPDEQYLLPIPEGSYDYVRLCEKITLPNEKVASVGIFVEGTNYTGKLFLEMPFLTCGEYNILPDFAPPVTNKPHFLWTGQHLSRKEWPVFRVTLNGTVIHEGEIFERTHRQSDWGVTIPHDLMRDQNCLCYELLSDYHDALPYRIHECGIVATDGGVFALVSTSPVGVLGKTAKILVRTERDDLTVTVACPDGKLGGAGDYHFAEAGLHGISLPCPTLCTHATFSLKADGKTVTGEIPAVIEREEDGVITGTSDAVYIAQEPEDMEEFLSWYFGENVGNFITFRPVYRWCGTREINPAVWKTITRLLNELCVKYAVLTDGRELPGQDCNPTLDQLEGEHFIGRQQHEHDGKGCYWGTGEGRVDDTHRQLWDLTAEIRKEHPDRVHSGTSEAVYVGDRMYLYADPTVPRDLKGAAERFIARARDWRYDQIRHTGPSVLFKYLYEAGLTWQGAETMYSGTEILLAYLRGFAKAKGLPSFGVHHAVQWSSVPHDVPEKYRRFRLALYASYMLGVHEVNTEEGLWRVEEFFSHFHRFDDCCRALTETQQDFYRFVATHSRKGQLHTPIALLHGRYDGRTAFSNELWGFLPSTQADKSWELLHLYFPLDEIFSHLHIHNCPTDRPLGYHSGTPYGQIDVLPIEDGASVYGDYRLLAFAGYNCAEKQDLLPLLDHVRKGGRLLLSWAHLTSTTNYDDVAAGRLDFDTATLGLSEELTFAESAVGGHSVFVCTNAPTPTEVLSRTDDGAPLLCRYRIGKGDVLLYNVKAYPAHPAISEAYTATLRELTEEVVRDEPIFAVCDTDVSFSTFKSGEETHLYFLAVDWYRSPDFDRTATLRLPDASYTVRVPFGVLVKCVTDGKTAVWCHSENAEVLSLANGITVQGTGTATFTVASGGVMRELTVSFDDHPIKTL